MNQADAFISNHKVFKEDTFLNYKHSNNKIKLSVSIPYKQRLDNLSIVFEALKNQTMDKSEFEIIVGAMEYCPEYLNLCKKYIDHFTIVSVLSADEFSIPKARNLSMRQARGNIIVQMDADTLLPPTALQNLYDRHFSFGQEICIVGQVVGYGNNNDGHVDKVELQPYESFKNAIQELQDSKGKPRDPRFQVDHVIPWAFGWTGFISLPLSLVRKNNLYFDEDFNGWGVDDLEWSYRISRYGIPIVLCEDVQAIHLPHARDPEANRKTEKKNYQRFLSKWPGPDVELAHAFGDVQANSLYLDLMTELKNTKMKERSILGTVRGTVNQKDILYVGVEIDKNYRIINQEIRKAFDNLNYIEVLPLIGMGLPYQDKEINECMIMDSISSLSEIYRNAVQKEVERVSKKVVWPSNFHKV